MTGRGMRRAGAAAGVGSLALAAVVGFSGPGAAAGSCVPTVSAPTLEAAPGPVEAGGDLTVTGAGWCHPTDGGSRVAIKIDEGAYSRLDSTVHANRTIWAIVEADPTDGTFTLQMKLPDGTTGTSTPALTSGSHTLRALSGSIKPDDEIRSVQSGSFVVGEYQPNGAPDLLGDDDLTPAAEDEVLGAWKAGRLLVSVDGGAPGDWVFASLLAGDGSPRYPWGNTWLRLDERGRVLLPLAEGNLAGEYRLVVQDGNQATASALLGWTTVTFTAGTPTAAPTTSPTPTPGPSDDDRGTPKKKRIPSATPSAPAPTATVLPPRTVPGASAVGTVPTAAAPLGQVLPATMPSLYRGWASMSAAEELASTLDGDVLRVQLGYAATGETQPADVFVHVVTGEGQHPSGWTRAAEGSQVLLDLRDLPDGDYRFSLQDPAGKSLGWAQATLAAASNDTSVAAASLLDAAAVGETPMFGERDLWLSGVGLALLAGLGIGAGASRAPRRSSVPEEMA